MFHFEDQTVSQFVPHGSSGAGSSNDTKSVLQAQAAYAGHVLPSNALQQPILAMHASVGLPWDASLPVGQELHGSGVVDAHSVLGAQPPLYASSSDNPDMLRQQAVLYAQVNMAQPLTETVDATHLSAVPGMAVLDLRPAGQQGMQLLPGLHLGAVQQAEFGAAGLDIQRGVSQSALYNQHQLLVQHLPGQDFPLALMQQVNARQLWVPPEQVPTGPPVRIRPGQDVLDWVERVPLIAGSSASPNHGMVSSWAGVPGAVPAGSALLQLHDTLRMQVQPGYGLPFHMHVPPASRLSLHPQPSVLPEPRPPEAPARTAAEPCTVSRWRSSFPGSLVLACGSGACRLDVTAPWIIVRGMAPWVDHAVLRDWFTRWGDLKEIRLFNSSRGRESNRWIPRNFAFLRYATPDGADASVRWMHGCTFMELTTKEEGLLVSHANMTTDKDDPSNAAQVACVAEAMLI